MMKMIFVFLCFLALMGNSSAHKLAPALYVFGDSTVDTGNVNTTKPLSSPPYGEDFPWKNSDRLTNGYTMADFLAEWLGLVLPPPYIKVYNNRNNNNVTEGINYAIRGSRILDGNPSSSGNASVRAANLGLQLDQFRATVEEYLPTKLTSNETLSTHLANSIFMLSVGGNDYLISYLPSLRSPTPLTATQFADKVIDQLATYLKDLYNLGGRKFLVNEMGPVGNFPVPKFAPPSGLTPEKLNQLALIYNERLAAKLTELTSSLQCSTFVQFKSFKIAQDLILNPSKYGVVNSKEPCCKLNRMGGCEPNSFSCSNRTEYVFFDSVHPTEITYKTIALSCFNGTTGVCLPTVKELAEIDSTGKQAKTEEKDREILEEAETHVLLHWIQSVLCTLFGCSA